MEAKKMNVEKKIKKENGALNAMLKYPGVKLGTLLAGISLACGILVYTVPDAATKALSYLTHSTWSFTINPFNPATFAAGLALWFVIGVIVGFAHRKLCDCCK